MKRFLIFHKLNHPDVFKLHFFLIFFLIIFQTFQGKKKPAGKGENQQV